LARLAAYIGVYTSFLLPTPVLFSNKRKAAISGFWCLLGG
jgi:hypothetical protein